MREDQTGPSCETTNHIFSLRYMDENVPAPNEGFCLGVSHADGLRCMCF